MTGAPDAVLLQRVDGFNDRGGAHGFTAADA